MAVTVEPADALPEYQRRYGNLHNDLLIRDVAIAKLERELADARAEIASLQQGAQDTRSAVNP